MISGSGIDLRNVTSQEQVHAAFGTPKRTELVEGRLVEHYVTRRNLEEYNRATGEVWMAAYSLGASEAIALPLEVYFLTVRTVAGQEIQVHYDADGTVESILGKNVGFLAPGLGKIEPYQHLKEETDTDLPIDNDQEKNR